MVQMHFSLLGLSSIEAYLDCSQFGAIINYYYYFQSYSRIGFCENISYYVLGINVQDFDY